MQTTEKEEDKARSTFTNSSTVSFSRRNTPFLRVDGLLGTDDINEYIIDLITHYHADHISRSAVEKALIEGNFNRLIVPNPVLPASRNEVFSMLNEYRELTQTVPGGGQHHCSFFSVLCSFVSPARGHDHSLTNTLNCILL